MTETFSTGMRHALHKEVRFLFTALGPNFVCWQLMSLVPGTLWYQVPRYLVPSRPSPSPAFILSALVVIPKDDEVTTQAVELVDVDAANNLPGFEFR